MLNIVIKSNERIFIAGKTGSGKSFLTKQIIKQLPRYLIIDPSWEYSQLGYVVHTETELTKCNKAKIVYQSVNPSSIEEFDRVCRIAFNSSNFTVVIDEIHLYTAPQTIPQYLKNLIVMGRKKGIGLIMISQRPALTNSTCCSQASHIICFNLFLERDIEFFKNFLGEHAEQIRKLENYQYMHYDIPANKLDVRNQNGQIMLSML